ncbi:MAG: DUF6537 domain-containing protein [Rubrivivax sp.]
MSLAKLMSYKDEYEVARSSPTAASRASPAEQFEGDLKLEFHMAPPFIARPGPNGEPPKKVRLAAWWLLPAMKVLARARCAARRWTSSAAPTNGGSSATGFTLRGARGRAAAATDARRLPLAVQVAQVPLAMRGYGHVKLANVALARTREAELLHRLDPRATRPPRAAQAGQFKGACDGGAVSFGAGDGEDAVLYGLAGKAAGATAAYLWRSGPGADFALLGLGSRWLRHRCSACTVAASQLTKRASTRRPQACAATPCRAPGLARSLPGTNSPLDCCVRLPPQVRPAGLAPTACCTGGGALISLSRAGEGAG